VSVRYSAKVGDLPVQQPTSFRLVINRKAVKTIGMQIPASLLAQEFIE
jgi:putative ABC transport system substrate-binding protein